MEYVLNITGIVKLEGSKSIINRVLIISTFLDSSLKIKNISKCNDVMTLIKSLKKLGLQFDFFEDSVIIHPPAKIRNNQKLYIHDSGTAFRFLITRLAILEEIHTNLDISSQLRRRPIEPLLEILKKMSAEIEFENYPFKINGTQLQGGELNIPANISSQFISALLLIAPNYKSDLILNLQGKIVSRPYIKMTIKIMKDFGIESEFSRNKIIIKAGQKYKNPGEYEVEPDFSSACYFWALGALSKREVCTSGCSHQSLQPDFQFLKILEEMGAFVSIKNNKICVKKGILKGINIDMKDIPDQVPTLAVLALFADSPTKIQNIAHLKFKESDRIKSLITELKKSSTKIEYSNGILTIYPLAKKPPSIELKTYDDHRLVMAFHILKAVVPYIRISGIDAVDKSYPNFISDFMRICNNS